MDCTAVLRSRTGRFRTLVVDEIPTGNADIDMSEANRTEVLDDEFYCILTSLMAEGNLDQAVTGPMIAALAIVTLCNPTL